MSDDVSQRTDKLLGEQLPGVDLEDASNEDLIVASLHVLQSRHTMRIVAGRLFAELHRRGLSYSEISALVKVPKPTVHRWAAPFLVEVTDG